MVTIFFYFNCFKVNFKIIVIFLRIQDDIIIYSTIYFTFMIGELNIVPHVWSQSRRQNVISDVMTESLHLLKLPHFEFIVEN